MTEPSETDAQHLLQYPQTDLKKEGFSAIPQPAAIAGSVYFGQPDTSSDPALGTFWVGELDGPLPASPIPRIPAIFMRVGLEVVQELALAMEDDQAIVLQRFARGKHCYVARVEGRIASYGWVTFDEEGIGELGISVRLQTGEAYIWGCATLPAYRGQRLYPALLAYIIHDLQRNGIHRAWIGADADNQASQNGLVVAGLQPVADAVLTMNRLWVRGRPGVPEQIVADARRAMYGTQDSAWLDTRPSV
ncbi:MAG: GNAT family N-acetyltransferase [Chloroflexi bacterium]|nr:GNAT family N-acetyltransferase [Chloroflexota bacterium]